MGTLPKLNLSDQTSGGTNMWKPTLLLAVFAADGQTHLIISPISLCNSWSITTVGHEEQHTNQPNTITETVTQTKMLLFLFLQPNVISVTTVTTKHEFIIQIDTL